MREHCSFGRVEYSVASAPAATRNITLTFALTMVLALISVPIMTATGAHAKVVSGSARIIDGDTIDVNGERIRLEGIDTPEKAQTCPRRASGKESRASGTWKCGRAASRALEKLIAGRNVRCQSNGYGKHGRLIGTCFVAKKSINEHMVRNGHAWAFVKYSTSYVRQERAARKEKLGIWSGHAKATPAWQYRARRWAHAKQTAPKGCAIKGNISARGVRIYHAPWSRWYDKVVIDKSRGEQWFCSESEAKAQGWRAANNN